MYNVVGKLLEFIKLRIKYISIKINVEQNDIFFLKKINNLFFKLSNLTPKKLPNHYLEHDSIKNNILSSSQKDINILVS